MIVLCVEVHGLWLDGGGGDSGLVSRNGKHRGVCCGDGHAWGQAGLAYVLLFAYNFC